MRSQSRGAQRGTSGREPVRSAATLRLGGLEHRRRTLAWQRSTPHSIKAGALRANFSAVVHHHGLLDHSGTAWFEVCFCTPTHVRCGSDLKVPLQDAGFRGDFYEHNYPYLTAPVREGSGCLEERAQFLVDSYADSRDPPLQYEPVLRGLERDEQRLHDSANYDRVVIWSEFDCYDQLVLVRLLGHYATHHRPRRLELINIGEFPGAVRFIGLGQLPPRRYVCCGQRESWQRPLY